MNNREPFVQKLKAAPFEFSFGKMIKVLALISLLALGLQRKIKNETGVYGVGAKQFSELKETVTLFYNSQPQESNQHLISNTTIS